MIIWSIGISGAGKSTMNNMLIKYFKQKNTNNLEDIKEIINIDSDEIRKILRKPDGTSYGYTKNERTTYMYHLLEHVESIRTSLLNKYKHHEFLILVSNAGFLEQFRLDAFNKLNTKLTFKNGRIINTFLFLYHDLEVDDIMYKQVFKDRNSKGLYNADMINIVGSDIEFEPVTFDYGYKVLRVPKLLFNQCTDINDSIFVTRLVSQLEAKINNVKIYYRLLNSEHNYMKHLVLESTDIFYSFLKHVIDNKSFYIKDGITNIGMLWSGGKDSTVLLHLLMMTYKYKLNKMEQEELGPILDAVVPIHIDTKRKIPEIIKFKNYLNTKLDNKIITISKDIEEDNVYPNAVLENNRIHCCNLLKTDQVKALHRQYGFDVLFVGLRGDEENSRSKEKIISKRVKDQDSSWNIVEFTSMEIPEVQYDFSFNRYNETLRIHPLLHWTELDVWKYIEMFINDPDDPLEIVQLYYSKDGRRYRTIGCACCTAAIYSDAKSIKDIIIELEYKYKGVKERSTRIQDNEFGLEDLRKLGYM